MKAGEASDVLQKHTGLPLLESLELMQSQVYEDLHAWQEGTPNKVKVAYWTLMIGFTELIG